MMLGVGFENNVNFQFIKWQMGALSTGVCKDSVNILKLKYIPLGERCFDYCTFDF